MNVLSGTLSKVRMAVVVLLWAIPAAAIGPADAQPAPTLKIVATTSLIAEIVADVGGDAVEIAVLIPPASCPGHFDIKPGDMRMLADAHLFFLHSWQGRMFSDGIVRASGNHGLRKVAIDVPGNWMTPSAQIAATERIAALLTEIDPTRAASYRAAALRRIAAVERVGSAQSQRMAAAKAPPAGVMANAMQADFVRWAGLQVVGEFGRGEDMSPRDIEEAIRLGRSLAVRLVVDNLQSGKQVGIGVAKEIGAAHVTLSNFPGGFEGTETWAKAIERNVDLLVTAIGR